MCFITSGFYKLGRHFKFARFAFYFCVKNSARMFQQLLPTCRIYEAKGYGHGYLSVYLPEEWLRIALPFFEGKDPNAPGE